MADAVVEESTDEEYEYPDSGAQSETDNEDKETDEEERASDDEEQASEEVPASKTHQNGGPKSPKKVTAAAKPKEAANMIKRVFESAALPPPGHPPVTTMVLDAIKTLNDKNGSSLQAIKKHLATVYLVDVERTALFIRKAIKRAMVDDKIVQVKGTGANGSFKLATKELLKKKAAMEREVGETEKPEVKAPGKKPDEKAKMPKVVVKKSPLAKSKKAASPPPVKLPASKDKRSAPKPNAAETKSKDVKPPAKTATTRKAPAPVPAPKKVGKIPANKPEEPSSTTKSKLLAVMKATPKPKTTAKPNAAKTLKPLATIKATVPKKTAPKKK